LHYVEIYSGEFGPDWIAVREIRVDCDSQGYCSFISVNSTDIINDEPSEGRPEINPTFIKLTKLICLKRRNWRANGPRRSTTSALKTTAVNVKSAIATLILRLEILSIPALRMVNVARLTKQKISYV
jgi:hypothetical protein